MTSLESSIASADVGPIAGLNFSLPPVSSFVIGRQESYFVPSGNTFSPAGVRTLRINASGAGFADLSTAVLEFQVTNGEPAGGHHLQPITTSGGSFFSELRILCGGIEAERIGGGSCSYTRIEEALSKSLPLGKRIDAAGLGFGVDTTMTVTGPAVYNNALLNIIPPNILDGAFLPGSLTPNTHGVIWHKPVFGLGQQHLYCPLWALSANGLTFEFLLHANHADAVNTIVVAGVSGSQNWTISNVRLHMDILSLDQSLMASYANHLLSQKSLIVPYRTYTVVSFQHGASEETMLQIPRTFTRLCQVWLLFSRPISGATKDGNHFPIAQSAFNTIEGWIQVGAEKWPSTSYKGVREFYWRYLKALGYSGSGHHSTSNSITKFGASSFIMIFDLERVQTAFSGMNTHGGNLTVSLKGMGAGANDPPTRIDCLLWHDSCLEINDGTASVSF